MPYVTSLERIAEERGVERGLQQGLRDGLLANIDVVLEVKFGDAGLQLLPEIREIDSVETLQTILQTLRTAKSLDEIRQLYANEN